MIKRMVSCAAALLCAAVLLAGSALAAVTPGRYSAISCVKDGKSYRCQGDYVLIYEDGTGEVAFNDEVCALTWTESDGAFRAEDEDGYSLTGQFADGRLTVSYAGYDYIYQLDGGESALLTPGRYDAVSCTKDGTSYKCQGEYVFFLADGAGELKFNDEVRSFYWTGDKRGFSAEDEQGRQLTGAVADGQLEVSYVGYDYIYQWGGESIAPPFEGSVENIAPEMWGSGLPYVLDQAGILTAEQGQALAERAREISQSYPCDVHIITLDDYTKYSNGSIERCAEEIRTGYDLGQGDDRDCIVLILSMSNRRYDIVIHGDYTHRIFPDKNREAISRKFRDNFKKDDWYGGLRDYLNGSAAYLKSGGKEITPIPEAVLGALIPSFLAGLIYCIVQKRKMQAVAEQTRAGAYVAEDGCRITYRADNYTGTTVSRTYSPRSSGSGGGGRSSSGGGGHSHTSGSF